MAETLHNELFSSLICDIKTYTGKDPLLPWLRGIRKMKESLPPRLLKVKLPRFLQKCVQTFETDRRYRNDLRYLRVWIQLLDFVDDPRALLKTMEANRIGTKLAIFYQAYALYYEKLKRFEEAENMYRLGVQNLAEPANELQNSYEQFLRRMELKKGKSRVGRTVRKPLAARTIPTHSREIEEKAVEESYLDKGKINSEAHLHPSHLGISSDFSPKEEVIGTMDPRSSFKHQESNYVGSNKPITVCNEDAVVVKFVDTAIVGKSEPEDACHHGLLDPTINMKEVMNAINGMFREPLELEPVGRKRSHRTQARINQTVSNGFEVFVDKGLDNGVVLSDQKVEKGCSLPLDFAHPTNPTSPKRSIIFETKEPLQEPFKIFVDEEGDDIKDENSNLGYHEAEHPSGSTMLPAPHVNAFVFPCPKDLSPSGSDNQNMESSTNLKFREDTVVGRFVGSTILDGPEVENACHHGLVEPTINLKEAMDDINSMFGKPLDFVRTKRPKKQPKESDSKREFCGFSILPDDDVEEQPKAQAPSSSFSKLGMEFDLFEPTLFTKEAMADINEMFGKALDF
ncbi:uncharacterized protein LOC122088408 [Macadamia integrifolia]|uniref:uncharacterized protein LOC122088408 n=1 Tax=Macadamia integrifolia TaxID=60698 RepID=UPI001C4F4156|nr:uncharacterized protein LOC122088408 [Macadamia integrifolia]